MKAFQIRLMDDLNVIKSKEKIGLDDRFRPSTINHCLQTTLSSGSLTRFKITQPPPFLANLEPPTLGFGFSRQYVTLMIKW